MTDEAAETAFREAVGREGSLLRLGRALALSDRGSFHLLDVLTPRTLRAAVPRLLETVGARGLAQVRVTLEQMSSREGLTTAVFAALGASESAATALLIDASAALPSEADAWTWCLDRWNERRDRIAAERTAPVVLAAPSWLVGLLSESAPDLWSVRGPSARVDVAPPPAIAMIDRVPVGLIASGQDWPTVGAVSEEDVTEALLRLDVTPTNQPTDVRGAALILLMKAMEWHRSWETTKALHLLESATRGAARLHAASPDDEEPRFFYASTATLTGELHRQLENFEAALTSHTSAFLALSDFVVSDAWATVWARMTASTGLEICHIQLLLGEPDRARLGMDAGRGFLNNVIPQLPGDLLAIAQVATSTRLDAVTGQYQETLDTLRRFSRAAISKFSPEERCRALVVLAEFHLDRGDFDRVKAQIIEVLDTTKDADVSVRAARYAVGAGSKQLASDLLHGAMDTEVFAERTPPLFSSEIYVLGAEVARALGDDALTHQYVTLAQAALDDLQRRDPTSPRCARLLARFAEQRLAPTQR